MGFGVKQVMEDMESDLPVPDGMELKEVYRQRIADEDYFSQQVLGQIRNVFDRADSQNIRSGKPDNYEELGLAAVVDLHESEGRDSLNFDDLKLSGLKVDKLPGLADYYDVEIDETNPISLGKTLKGLSMVSEEGVLEYEEKSGKLRYRTGAPLHKITGFQEAVKAESEEVEETELMEDKVIIKAIKSLEEETAPITSNQIASRVGEGHHMLNRERQSYGGLSRIEVMREKGVIEEVDQKQGRYPMFDLVE